MNEKQNGMPAFAGMTLFHLKINPSTIAVTPAKAGVPFFVSQDWITPCVTG
jgi:hypothetical protein